MKNPTIGSKTAMTMQVPGVDRGAYSKTSGGNAKVSFGSNIKSSGIAPDRTHGPGVKSKQNYGK